MAFISFSLVVLAVLLAIPVAVFIVEVMAAIALPRRDYSVPLSKAPRRRIAVLVPAHNESAGLLPTLGDIKVQMRTGDRLLVVADNCSDDTAAVATAAGADVVIRTEPDRKGKGYALAFGLHHLDADPPDIVIIVDADCRLPNTAIDKLAATCAVTKRPVQSLSSMIMPDGSPIDVQVAEFAWHVKNYVRPQGLCNLGLPCQLMGSGMAFPWAVIRTADLASGSIVEDLKLGLDLAMAGKPPIFCPFPGVISDFPFTVEGRESQSLRWERGHLSTILMMTPRLLFAAIARADLGLLALAFDVAVPPLTLLAMLLLGMLVVTALTTLLGVSSTALLISSASFAVLMGVMFICWLKFGRGILPVGSVFKIFPYMYEKVFLYAKILSRQSSAQWVRTDRTKI